MFFKQGFNFWFPPGLFYLDVICWFCETSRSKIRWVSYLNPDLYEIFRAERGVSMNGNE